MAIASEAISILVIDDDTEILAFFARVLDAGGMRALLAHNAHEAIGIVKRGYVPIDLVLTDVYLKPETAPPDLSSGPELVDRLRQWRPQIRALYMSAYLDSGVIRVELMDRELKSRSPSLGDRGLIESIRIAATAPLVRTMGGQLPQ